MIITIPGNPITRSLKHTRSGRVYNPRAKEEKVIQLFIKNEARKNGFRRDDSKQLAVSLKFYINKNSPGRPCDPDNLEKVYRDAIKRAGLVKDDSNRYIMIISREYYREPNIESRTVIEIRD